MAKAIPVRGAKFREADVQWRLLSAFISTGYALLQVHPRSLKTTRSHTLLLVKLVRFAFYQHAGGTVMSLTDTKVKNARPAEKAVKLTDGFGLYRFKILADRLSLQWQTEGVFYWGLPCGFSYWCQTTPWRGQKAAGSGDWPERKKQADEKILQEKRDKTRSSRVVAKSWCAIILPMILTEIFSPAPEIYLPFPLPASDCLYQPFLQNISRLKFILPPALNLYGVMSQNYLPSACQFFTFHQTPAHSHCGKVTAFDLCNYRQSCAMPGQSRN